MNAKKEFEEDWTQFDKYYHMIKGHTVCLLLGRMPLYADKELKLSGAERKKYHKEAYSRWVSGMKKRGLDYDDWQYTLWMNRGWLVIRVFWKLPAGPGK